ncbi:ABC transporter [Annulohypoxylon maeteangense]|uniref:ABC transporter n=1 Tax=Annulohypoxylon maeteangense TaxID=1927788 RepID=UPI002008718A|nr:ABC transporter [Annulohypoxylon maeteangense]KAI0889767.1 ABC transporter [Annulohypoxylon maeteangense]
MARIASSADAVAVFSILLSSLFLCVAFFRLWRLRRAPAVVISGFQGHSKTVLSILFTISSLGRLIALESSTLNELNLHIASRTLELAAASVLCVLSWLKHRRSIRPSDTIIIYLVACLIRDCFELPSSIRGQSDWLMQDPILAQLVLETSLLATETLQKDLIKKSSNEDVSSEEKSSILGRTFFWWINPILYEGYHNVLLGYDLPSIDAKLLSKPTRAAALLAWEQRLRPENAMTLPRVLLKCLIRPFLFAIPPRLFLTLFRYSQPVIIRQAITFVTTDQLRNQTWTGPSLVMAAVVVYIGLAISTTAYQHKLNKLRMMVRAALVGLIHDKTMNSYAEAISEGKVLTLANTDVDNLDTIGEMVHETWGQVLEVIIGIGMLAWQVGWFSLVPIFIIFLCSRVSQYVARNLRSRSGSWNEATQSRISMTSSAISAIKNIKMLGLQGAISARIEELRRNELHKANSVRWMMTAYNASANANGMFAPVLTLVLYAISAKMRGSGLDTATAFTTIAILTMVTHPANMVMTIIPKVIASFASFERIQNFLLEPSRQDYRIDISNSKAVTESGSSESGFDTILPPALTIEGLCAGESRLALEDVHLTVRQGSIVVLSGATASGKSILAQSILSEIPSIGMIAVSSKRIGYCSQIPWLPNGSIQQIITDFHDDSVADFTWYKTVLDACCLMKDIDALPDGDETLVGSRGINLSGGQRQRLALARAIFARTEILILDDPFSALDGRTESQIVENLFGNEGLFRKLGTTVLFISNSAQYFYLADEVIVLENGRIKEHGKWNELAIRDPEILKIITSEDGEPKRSVTGGSDPLSQQQRSYEDVTIDLKRKTGDSTLYGYYIKAAGLGNSVFVIACTAIYSFFITFPQYWVKMWTGAESSNDWFFIGGYIFLNFVAYVVTNMHAWATNLRMAPHSGLILHFKLLHTIIRAPLQYFSMTDNGSIINRFSQDLQLVDRQLASVLSSVFVQTFKLLVQVILLFVSQKLLTFTLPICFIFVYAVQKVYLRTSRQLRLLELESRSLVFIDLLETVDGLTTIRAFEGQSKAEFGHLHRLDESQKPFYLLLCLQCWLKIVLDLLVAAVAVGVIAIAVILRNTTSGGQVGVALNIVLIANTTLLKLVQYWTSLEISLGAIARIKNLEDEVFPEDQPFETSVPPETWPSSGAVEFRGVTAAYNTENTVLEDVSLRIEPGQKVVICGRTGSGKSSLLLTLLRLLDTKSGSIIVDGVNIGLVPRSVIRERCFVTVPQEPLLFNEESLRFNVDPTETLSNDTIIEVLSKVYLWQHFSSNLDEDELGDDNASTHLILDRTLTSLPPLSVGQRQLLALARALLQVYVVNTSGAKPIILLDEATSSLDSSTEKVILDIINEELASKGHTVIMVAHRVGAAVSHLREGVDAVVWMKDGRIEKVGDANDIVNLIEQTVTPEEGSTSGL